MLNCKMLCYTVKPLKLEHRKLRTYKLIFWDNALKDENQKQNDFFPCFYEILQYILQY